MNLFRSFWQKHPLIILAVAVVFFTLSHHFTNGLRGLMNKDSDPGGGEQASPSAKGGAPSKDQVKAAMIAQFNAPESTALSGPVSVEVMSVDVIPRKKKVFVGNSYREGYPCRVRWKLIRHQVRTLDPSYNQVEEYDDKEGFVYQGDFGDWNVVVSLLKPSFLGANKTPYTPHPGTSEHH